MPQSWQGHPDNAEALVRLYMHMTGHSIYSSLSRVNTGGNAGLRCIVWSPWRGNRRVFERRKPLLTGQLQPSTNADKLSGKLYQPWLSWGYGPILPCGPFDASLDRVMTRD